MRLADIMVCHLPSPVSKSWTDYETERTFFTRITINSNPPSLWVESPTSLSCSTSNRIAGRCLPSVEISRDMVLSDRNSLPFPCLPLVTRGISGVRSCVWRKKGSCQEKNRRGFALNFNTNPSRTLEWRKTPAECVPPRASPCLSSSREKRGKLENQPIPWPKDLPALSRWWASWS